MVPEGVALGVTGLGAQVGPQLGGLPGPTGTEGQADENSPEGLGDRIPASDDASSPDPGQSADPASAGAGDNDSPGEPDEQDPTGTDKA